MFPETKQGMLELMKSERSDKIAEATSRLKETEALKGLPPEIKEKQVKDAESFLNAQRNSYDNVIQRMTKEAEEEKAQNDGVQATLDKIKADKEAKNTDVMKTKARQAFVAAGGASEDFEAAWPGILQARTAARLR